VLIDEEVARFSPNSRCHDAGPAIRACARRGDGIRLQTLEQAHRMLAAGRSTDEVIEFLARHPWTNRLLHAPTRPWPPGRPNWPIRPWPRPLLGY